MVTQSIGALLHGLRESKIEEIFSWMQIDKK